MKILTRIAVLFYVTLTMFISVTMILFILNFLNVESLQKFLFIVSIDQELKLIVGIIAGIFLLMNFVFYKMFSVNTHKEKIIAFDNPAGRVSVSLIALEDLIKRTLFKLTEITDIKPSVLATKKGLIVKLRIVFSSEINIPEATSKVQEIVKRKVQDTIGLDEPVSVTIFVGKILSQQIKEKTLVADKKEKSKESEPEIPFRGYRT